MWIVFSNCDEGLTAKDLLRLIVSLEKPSRVGVDGSNLYAEITDRCGPRILQKHIHIVRSRLGKDVTIRVQSNVPAYVSLRRVTGTVDA